MEGMFFETKGYFPNEDRQKMRAVFDCNPNIDLYMVFPEPRKTIRKGSKTTYGDWCDKHGIPWVALEELQKMITEDPKGYVDTLRRRKKGLEFKEYYGRGIGAIVRDGKSKNARNDWSGPALALAKKGKRGPAKPD